MQMAQQGDRVLVQYALRLEDGSPAFRRPRKPLELTVGVEHPRLPGLGRALVGLAPGGRVAVTVPPEQAYGPYDPDRIYRLSRTRLAGYPELLHGKWVRMTDGRGRRRLVRILSADDRAVVVDNNHPLAGHTLEVEVELIAIQAAGAGPASGRGRPRVVAFDVDERSLASLREALPDWEVRAVRGATADSLSDTWDPRSADLLVVGLAERVTETLALCRLLAFCAPYSGDARAGVGGLAGPSADRRPRRVDAPLLVLVPAGRETLVGSALEAGAHSCLTLPVHAKDVASMVTHARAGNQPGRHTLGSEQAQRQDPWRDDGGES